MRAVLIRQVVLLIGIAFLPAIGEAIYFRGRTSWTKPPPIDALEVTVDQAKRWGDQVLWVDARPDAQFAAGHIPGAIQLNEDRWDELVRETLAKWSPQRKLVVYCSQQTCDASHEVAERLRHEAGLTNVYVLAGGWEEWQKQNR